MNRNLIIRTPLKSDKFGPPCRAKCCIFFTLVGEEKFRNSTADWDSEGLSNLGMARRVEDPLSLHGVWSRLIGGSRAFLRSSSCNARFVNQIFDKLFQNDSWGLYLVG